MDIKIRDYQKKDCNAILEIINDAILNSTALYDYNIRSLASQEAIFEEKIKKGFPVLVAEQNATIVGFGYFSEFRFREAYKFTAEHSVYAHKDQIGKGIGKLLLTELIARAAQQKLHTLIGVIDAENTNSIDFHKKFGFDEVGFIKESGFKFNRWLHSVIMQKML
ncbi:GNAT family N-acetyltransferase [Flavobacterium sp.]|jgi:L-amino acid N-acyltransferase YncA|uniref:GNAT family N-acetyltransferase n=1 Tax=Flavobacterium sp. TaxID=239 RepID=UPI0037BFFBF2